jgi:hypothetical protein
VNTDASFVLASHLGSGGTVVSDEDGRNGMVISLISYRRGRWQQEVECVWHNLVAMKWLCWNSITRDW